MSLDDDEAVALLHTMVEIPSPSGEEERLARTLETAMTKLGFTAYRDEVGNLIGEIGTGDGPTVMFLSHLDTVPGEIPVRRTTAPPTAPPATPPSDQPSTRPSDQPSDQPSDRLYGRGAVDAKGALGAMVSAAARRPGFPGTIRVVGAVEEERMSRGGHHIARTQEPPDALIVGEPGGWSGVVLGYKGKADLEYRVTRPPTHSTNPVRKASEEVAAFWQGLLEALGPDRDHGAFGLPAATLRAIRGNLTEAWIDVDCRTPPGFDAAAFVARLEELARAGGGELTVHRHIPAVRSPRSDPSVRALSAAIRQAGGTPRPTLKTGTSDMNTVSERWSLPMAAYGPGDAALDHSDDEHIEIAEYLRAITVLTTTLDELAAALPRPTS